MTKARKHRWHLIREHKRGHRANPNAKGVPGEVVCLARGCTAQKYLLPGTGYPGLSKIIGSESCPSC